MNACLVDTNVPVVANEDAPQASPACILACTRALAAIMRGDARLALDDNWLIIREYQRHLRSSGQPGVGDAFLKWVLTNLANPNRCELVHLSVADPSGSHFTQFPDDPALTDFDPADRKFVAVAVAHPDRPSILQAVDTNWWAFRDVLARCGVPVTFLCEDDIARLLSQ